ncbi:hypothetical protein [Nocardia alni]|uniref:hypothetical protein n=1 Tax=Nocardia alni TaxID=2815723 RepID=UPI001C22C184|nr:hypothetical protein [Nocardia alni]
MKTVLLTALAVPLITAIPVVAHADPGGPPAIFTPKQECDTERGAYNAIRKQLPPGATPEQIVDAQVKLLTDEGAYNGLRPGTAANDRTAFLERVHRCHIA